MNIMCPGTEIYCAPMQSQWGYTRNGAVFSMGRCSKRGGALNEAGSYQLRSKAQVVAGGSWSVLAAPQEVTMRSGGQVVEEADRGAIYAQGGGTQRRKQGHFCRLSDTGDIFRWRSLTYLEGVNSKKEPLIANQKLKTDVNRSVCYPRLRDFLTYRLQIWHGSSYG